MPVRNDLAMTGEITLRGRVLPIGGLKEKVLAAHRGGIKIVLIPKENDKDIEEIPAQMLKNVTLIQVEHMDEVLRKALGAGRSGYLLQASIGLRPIRLFPDDAEESAVVDDEDDDSGLAQSFLIAYTDSDIAPAGRAKSTARRSNNLTRRREAPERSHDQGRSDRRFVEQTWNEQE